MRPVLSSRLPLGLVSRAAIPLFWLMQLGCSDDAQVGDDRGAASASGSQSSTTTSTSTGPTSSSSTGAGASGGGGAGTGAGGSSSEGGGGSGIGGAGGGCPGAQFTVSGDGPTKEFNFACAGSYGIPYTTEANAHVGYEKPVSVDPNQMEQIWVDGCATANQQPFAGSISLEAPQPTVGTTMTGKAQYYDGIDAYATETDVTLTVTQIDATTVKGTYTATVQTVNNSVKMLSGTFGVCHVEDFFPP